MLTAAIWCACIGSEPENILPAILRIAAAILLTIYVNSGAA